MIQKYGSTKILTDRVKMCQLYQNIFSNYKNYCWQLIEVNASYGCTDSFKQGLELESELEFYKTSEDFSE